MGTLLLGLVLALNIVLLALVVRLFQRQSAATQTDVKAELAGQAENLENALTQRFTTATADMAMRLEQTKGDLRQQVADRLEEGFSRMRSAVDDQLTSGRREQSERLKEGRTELTQSLTMTTLQLKAEFDSLNQATEKSLNSIRDRVDEKLIAITDQVQRKLDESIKVGFDRFEKVLQHLKAAGEQLREVGALG